jgi:hypothetical protein
MSPKMLGSSSMIMVRAHMITLREKEFPTLITYIATSSELQKLEVSNDSLLKKIESLLFVIQQSKLHPSFELGIVHYKATCLVRTY